MDRATLLAYIESRFPCTEGFPTNVCQTDDHYVILGTPDIGGCPGIIKERQCRATFESETDAFLAAARAFDNYATGKSGILYWRTPPRIEKMTKGYRVYLRLVITNNPVIYETMDDLDLARLLPTPPHLGKVIV